MKRTADFLLLLILSTGFSHLIAQPIDVQIKFLSTGGSDEARSIEQTEDGGYIITGWTSAFGGIEDAYLLKLNKFGDMEWSNHWGGQTLDNGQFVQQTMDKGFIVIGQTYSFGGGGSDLWLIRTDSSGKTIWDKTFGNFENDIGYCVRETDDGGFITIGGLAFSAGAITNVWIQKINSSGNLIWSKTYARNQYNIGYSIAQTSDGNFIAAAFTTDPISHNDFWLMKLNSNGDTLWTKTFPESLTDVPFDIEETNDKGFILAGYTQSFGTGSTDFFLIKVDSLGNEMWNRTYGGALEEEAHSVKQAIDGGYVIAGWTRSFGAGDYDMYIVKTDKDGNLQWSQTYGKSHTDKAYSVTLTPDNGFVVTGSGFREGRFVMPLIKFAPISNEDILSVNKLIYSDSNEIKTSADFDFSLAQNYPNPFNPATIISWEMPVTSFTTLKVYDVLGNEITTLVNEEKPAGRYEINFEANNLSSGVYYYRITTGNFTQTKKMILMR